MATSYSIHSARDKVPEAAPEHPHVSMTLAPYPKLDGMGGHPAFLHVDEGAGNQTSLDVNLEDLVRLGRIAGALLEERKPNGRNYDAKWTRG